MKPLPAPAEARAVLHALGADSDQQVERLERYAGWLAGPGVERGLLGPKEVERVWPRHLVNCALLLPLLPESGSVCDLGSGAGLPGVVLAVLRPDLTMVLLEPTLRRSDFLMEVTEGLSLARTTVARARAEEYGRQQPGHDVVVARAVAPLPRLVGWAMPLLRPGGELLALKGHNVELELADAADELEQRGVVDREVHTLGEGGNVTHAVRAVRPPDALNRRATEDR